MTVFDDLAAEQERLAAILGGLDETQWASPSGARCSTTSAMVHPAAPDGDSHRASSRPPRMPSSRSCSAARSSKTVMLRSIAQHRATGYYRIMDASASGYAEHLTEADLRLLSASPWFAPPA